MSIDEHQSLLHACRIITDDYIHFSSGFALNAS